MSSMNSKYAEAKTGVFWDIEDCPIPSGLDLVTVSENIKSALAKHGYHGEVVINAFKEKRTIRNEFELAGINSVVAGDRHGRFRSMINSFLPWALRNRVSTNMLVISRDKASFASFLGGSIGERHNILLAESEDASEKCCKCGVALDKPPFKSTIESEEWVWSSLAFGGDPIPKPLPTKA